jgi:CRP-like cAMP-binding protein
MSAPVELLKRVPIFSELDSNELERLSRSFRDRTFEAGQEVVTEGRGGVGFFVVEQGEAQVSVGGEPRGTLGPGDYFGEIALIDEGIRSATVVASTDLKCWGLTAWEFRPLVETNGEIAWGLLKGLAHRLREAHL